MPIGRASCKECGTSVEHEVEEDVECQGCGRVFQIPNSKEYLPNPLRNHSLAKFSFGMGLDIRALNTQKTSGKNRQYGGIIEKCQTISAPAFPEHGEPDVMHEGDWLRVLICFQGHSADDISIAVVNTTLVIESTLPGCDYIDIIEEAILYPFFKIFETNFKNGILEIKLKA